jgi:uncharacterized RmlC-like cupin family protein
VTGDRNLPPNAVLASGRVAPLRHIPAGSLDTGTAQTAGMTRWAAITASSAGSEGIWMGQTHVAPHTRSADHHHGASETAIFVVAGHPSFVYLDGGIETRIETSPGDYVYVPPFAPHREENPSETEEALVVIARNTQEAIVVNLPGLTP